MSEHGRGRRFSGGHSTVLIALGLVVGCTTVAGLDKEYVAADEKADGGSAGALAGSGGRSGEGGSSAVAGNGGLPNSGGSSTGGTGPTVCDSASCGEGLKCCSRPSGVDSGIDPNERRCVPPNPGFGCSLTSCDACPAPPAKATSVCRGEACGFQCDPGYVQQGEQCVPDGAGGTGGSAGSGGSGGGPAQCTEGQCPACNNFLGPIRCCRKDGSGCGCTWFPTYCW